MLRPRCVSLVCALLSLAACNKKPAEAEGAKPVPSAKQPAAPVASGLPGVTEQVSKVVNPKNLPVYSGPTGSVQGVVSATGAPAPVATEHLKRIKGACPEAREAYGHAFREGMMRSLADVLVAVTGYEGYVPEQQPKQTIAARGCAFSTRTIAATFGQTIEVVSKDSETYVPNLLGSKLGAQLFALPGGAGSTLYPQQVGHYILTDDIKVFMMADVFVVAYSTHAVTGLDGRYQITGIPVGKARVSALLPATGAVIEKDVVIEAGKALEVALELPFDAKAFADKQAAAAASAAAAPSGAPAQPSP
ncbi:MAG TPA: hypothetical protein VIW29_00935 [Polyangiaceae bacterium]